MKTPIALVLLTTVGFGIGLASGMWMAKRKAHVPPPPGSILSEFRNVMAPGTSVQAFVYSRPDLWREINAELEKLRPESDAFRKKFDEIEGEFRAQLDATLEPAQRQRLADLQRHREPPRDAGKDRGSAKEAAKEQHKEAKETPPAAPTAAKGENASKGAITPPAGPGPRPDRGERPPRFYYESMEGIMAIVMLPYTLDQFTQKLELTSAQQERLRELLLTRRERFLELIDATPPPTMKLGRIADIVRAAQAAEPAKK